MRQRLTALIAILISGAMALTACGSQGTESAAGSSGSNTSTIDSASSSSGAGSVSSSSSQSNLGTADKGTSGSASQQSESTGGTIKIGVALSLTGNYETAGKDQRNSYEMWADWVNSRGGLDVDGQKEKVKLLFADDRSDPNTAIQLTENFINKDHVQFMFGPYSSALTLATSVISNRAKVIMMAGGAAGDNVFDRGLKYLFGTWTPTSYYFRSAIDVLAKQGLKRIAILASNEGAYAVMPKEAKAYAESKGIQIVSLQQVSQTVSDVSGPMLQIQKSNPQLFMVMTNSAPLTALASSTARTIGFSPKWYWSVGASNADTVKALGGTKNADTKMGPTQFQATTKLKGKYFTSTGWVKKYIAKYGAIDSFRIPMAFATGMVLGDAIEKAGSTDTEAVRKALLSGTFDTFVGPISFTKPGDKSGLTGASLSRSMPTLQWQSGKLAVVAPSDIADAPPATFKGWS